MKRLLLVLLIALALGVAGCSSQSGTEQTVVSQAATSQQAGFELSNFDKSVAPQQDFFRFVNGNWLGKTDIPADKARWGSFDELRENAEKQVLEIIQELAAAEHPKNSDAQKMADLYKSFLNEPLINTLGLNPLRGDIARIYFYMADKYNLNLSRAQQQLFIAWHKQDPATSQERELNQRIQQHMGHDNPFVSGKREWNLGYKPTGYGLTAHK